MLSGRWTDSHRCSWITVYVSCCNAQMNLIVDTMTCTSIVMHLSICQLPSCNLFTQHVNYLLWRDTTSELWTPIHSFTSDNTIYYTHCSLTFSTSKHIFHTIGLILCFSKPGRLTISLLSWGKVIWLCCMQVPRQLEQLTPSDAISSPTGSITLVSDTSKTYLLFRTLLLLFNL